MNTWGPGSKRAAIDELRGEICEKMKAFTLHLRYELAAIIRNRTLLLMNYLMPLGFYLLMGGVMTEINPFFADQMIPAMVTFAVLSATIMGVPTPLIEDREAGVLRAYRVHGIPGWSLITVPVVATGLHVGLVSLIIAISAPVLFGAPAPENPIAFVAVVALTFFALAGMGSLIGVISANGRIAILWQQTIFLPTMLLGGLMVPTEMLPDVFARVGHLFPATYGMQALLGLAFAREIPYPGHYAISTLLIGGLLSFFLVHRLFSWDDRESGRSHPALAALALLPYVTGALLLPL
ncbi:MAG: ABC transporter permease [Clostridia bacterium]